MLKCIKYITLLCIALPLMAMERQEHNHIPDQVCDLPEGVHAYLRNLPILVAEEARSITEEAQLITDFICQWSNSKKPIFGTEKIQEKVVKCIEHNEPIKLVLLGFPTKSANTETKVLQQKFDMGDFVALLSLHHLCEEIKALHAPGAVVTIYSREPYVYHLNTITSHALGIAVLPEELIECYQADLCKAASFFSTIKIGAIPNIRKLYDEQYAHIPVQAVHREDYKPFAQKELNSTMFMEAAREKVFQCKREEIIKKCPEFEACQSFHDAQRYLSAHTVCNQKRKYITTLPVKSYVKSIADKMAICLAEGGPRMRLLMSDSIPNYSGFIRLSIRSSDDGDVSNKMGIGLIKGSEGTPWHNVLVVTGNGIFLKPLFKLKNKKGHLMGTRKTYMLDGLNLEYVDQTSQ